MVGTGTREFADRAPESVDCEIAIGKIIVENVWCFRRRVTVSAPTGGVCRRDVPVGRSEFAMVAVAETAAVDGRETARPR